MSPAPFLFVTLLLPCSPFLFALQPPLLANPLPPPPRLTLPSLRSLSTLNNRTVVSPHLARAICPGRKTELVMRILYNLVADRNLTFGFLAENYDNRETLTERGLQYREGRMKVGMSYRYQDLLVGMFEREAKKKCRVQSVGFTVAEVGLLNAIAQQMRVKLKDMRLKWEIQTFRKYELMKRNKLLARSMGK